MGLALGNSHPEIVPVRMLGDAVRCRMLPQAFLNPLLRGPPIQIGHRACNCCLEDLAKACAGLEEVCPLRIDLAYAFVAHHDAVVGIVEDEAIRDGCDVAAASVLRSCSVRQSAGPAP